MNNELVEAYFRGIINRWITYDEKEMLLAVDCPIEYAVELIGIEKKVTRKDLSTKAVRRLPEFKKAIELSQSPLAGALK